MCYYARYGRDSLRGLQTFFVFLKHRCRKCHISMYEMCIVFIGYFMNKRSKFFTFLGGTPSGLCPPTHSLISGPDFVNIDKYHRIMFPEIMC